MNIIIVSDKNEVNATVGDIIASVIRANPCACLGLATGSTPEGVYNYLAGLYGEGKLDFSNVRTVNLDEYIGLPEGHLQSYQHYMNVNLFDRVNIKRENTYVPCGHDDPEEELRKFNKHLETTPRNIQLLGVGSNGHIGFNEPARSMHARANIVTLKEKTRWDNSRFFDSVDEVPKRAITMGMSGIFGAKKIVLSATGSYKADAIRTIVENDEIMTEMPCTFIKLHADATIVIDRELANESGLSANTDND